MPFQTLVIVSPEGLISHIVAVYGPEPGKAHELSRNIVSWYERDLAEKLQQRGFTFKSRFDANHRARYEVQIAQSLAEQLVEEHSKHIRPQAFEFHQNGILKLLGGLIILPI